MSSTAARPDQDLRVAVAVAAARAAGETARRHFRTGIAVEWKRGERGAADVSPVTAADREAERAAREVIAGRFPAHGFLGEELGSSGSQRTRWILDPIDGTANFIRGLPLFGALVALEEEGTITAAAAFNPLLDDLLWALRGGGAFRNGAPIRVSAAVDLAASLVVHGSAGACLRRGQRIDRLLAAAARDRSFGDYSGYVLVASGEAEVMVDGVAAPWDLAAPKLIIQEAGGRFTSLGGSDSIYEEGAVATNGPLHEAVLALIGASG
jgi:histidinol phosphatase-like enzyme (inositol monophosphatase family)